MPEIERRGLHTLRMDLTIRWTNASRGSWLLEMQEPWAGRQKQELHGGEY
jgi:hypothetical protein